MHSAISFQRTIAVTGTPQQLPNNLVNKSVTISAPSGNVGSIVLGNSPSVSATSGFILGKGTSAPLPVPGGNTNSIWAVGTEGDVFSAVGA